MTYSLASKMFPPQLRLAMFFQLHPNFGPLGVNRAQAYLFNVTDGSKRRGFESNPIGPGSGASWPTKSPPFAYETATTGGKTSKYYRVLLLLSSCHAQ